MVHTAFVLFNEGAFVTVFLSCDRVCSTPRFSEVGFMFLIPVLCLTLSTLMRPGRDLFVPPVTSLSRQIPLCPGSANQVKHIFIRCNHMQPRCLQCRSPGSVGGFLRLLVAIMYTSCIRYLFAECIHFLKTLFDSNVYIL